MQSEQNIITQLTIDELSHVDDPANEPSVVVLYKRRNKVTGDESMTPQELEDKVAKLEEDLTKMEEELKTKDEEYTMLKSEYEEMEKAVTEEASAQGFEMQKSAGGKVKLVKSADAYVDIGGEKFLKSKTDPAVLRVIEKQARDLEKMRADSEMRDLRKRAADTLPNIQGDDDTRAHLLKSVESISDETVRDNVMKSLRSADEAMKNLFKERGSSHVDEASPAARLEKMAKKHAAENNVTFHAAYAEVTKSGEGRKLAAEAQN